MDPNAIAKDSGYQDFKIKMIFSEVCQNDECPAKVKTGLKEQTGKNINDETVDKDETAQIMEQNFLNFGPKGQILKQP